MLTQMEVFMAGVLEPPFPIVDQNASHDPIQVKNIDGLGPVKATVNTTQYGSVDGEFYNGSFVPKRNIVITVGLNPNWVDQTVESLRQDLYTYFMPENEVKLRFTSTHLPPVEISGIVESCDPNMFAKDPEYQISIICPQPYFTTISSTVVTGVTEDLAGLTDVILTYEGNVPVGFVLSLVLPEGGTDFSGEVRVINKTPTTKLAIILPVEVSSDAYFQLSSVKGDKYARQYPLPSGLYTNILGNVSPGSTWLTLRKGDNRLQILSEVAGLDWAINYYARYGGL